MYKIRFKKIMGNLFLFFIILLICFAIFEVALRLMGKEGFPEEKKSVFIQHSLYNPFLIFGPNINYTFPQDYAEPAYFNSQGFRQKELLPVKKAFDEYRLFAMGGSTTENLGNQYNLHYCEEANQFLKNSLVNGKYFHCINAGNLAYTTAHSLVRLQFDLLSFKPDMVTLMHNINDLLVNFFSFDGRFNYGNKYLDVKYAVPYESPHLYQHKIKSLLKKSKSVFFTYDKLKSIRKKVLKSPYNMRFNPNSTDLKLKEIFENNLIAISRITKAHNITLVLMTQPAIFSDEMIKATYGYKAFNDRMLYPGAEEFERLFQEYNSVIESVARKEGIPFIDMYTLMGHNRSDYVDLIHYSRQGIKKFSEIYSENLKKIIEKESINAAEHNLYWP